MPDPGSERPLSSESGFAEMLSVLARTKRVTAQLYLECAAGAPHSASRIALQQIAEDERLHASQFAALLPDKSAHDASVPITPPGCSVNDQDWASMLMAVFALDQAVTGALVALAQTTDPAVAQTARRVASEEQAHAEFAVQSFQALADADAAVGRRLAHEMVEARDWVRSIFPRRQMLLTLSTAGLLPAGAPQAHDTFLASLGDRIQEALGVLGEF